MLKIYGVSIILCLVIKILFGSRTFCITFPRPFFVLSSCLFYALIIISFTLYSNEATTEIM